LTTLCELALTDTGHQHNPKSFQKDAEAFIDVVDQLLCKAKANGCNRVDTDELIQEVPIEQQFAGLTFHEDPA